MKNISEAVCALIITLFVPLIVTAIISFTLNCNVVICFWLCFLLNGLVIIGVVNDGQIQDAWEDADDD